MTNYMEKGNDEIIDLLEISRIVAFCLSYANRKLLV